MTEYDLFGYAIEEPIRKRFYSQDILQKYALIDFFRNAKKGLAKAVVKDIKLTADHLNDMVCAWPS